MDYEGLVNLLLLAMAIGCCVGVLLTGFLGNLFDLVRVVLERRWRIQDARTRTQTRYWPDVPGSTQ